MRTFQLRVTALVVSLLSGAAAQAVPVIYDFAGVGYVCTLNITSECTDRQYEGAFTGTITIDVLTELPTDPDAIVNEVMASAYGGWVESDFLIQWDGNSYNPDPIPGQTSSHQFVNVINDAYDRLTNREYYRRNDATGWFERFALLDRQGDSSWFDDVLFPVAGLAPPSTTHGVLNTIHFTERGYDTTLGGYYGYYGIISLTMLTARPTSVPEPATLSLFALGAAGMLLSRRRRRANA